MGLFSRLSSSVRSAVDGVVSSAEDPDQAADYEYERMRDKLHELEDTLTDLTAERKRLESRKETLEAEIEDLERRAAEELDEGNEDLARRAVGAKEQKVAERDRIDERIEAVETAEADLRGKYEDLEAEVERFRTHKETAEAKRRARGDPGGRAEEIDRAIERATGDVEGMEARSQALDELESEGAIDDGAPDEIERELDAAEADVDAELQRIRDEVNDES
jgi:phage shock protein A